MLKTKLAVTLATASLILAGCASTQPSTEVVAPAPEPEPIQLTDTSVPGLTVTYANEQIAGVCKVMNARIVKSGAFPKLTMQLVNFTQVKFPIEYKVQWVDADGMPLQSSAPWLQTTLGSMEVKPLFSLGKSLNAKSAMVSVRYPDPVQIYVPEPDPVERMQIERQVIDEYNARLAAGQIRQ